MVGSVVADPGFHRSWQMGALTLRWGANLLIGKIFAKYCMKMKEIGPGGERVDTAPLDLAMCCYKYRYR